MLLRWLWSCKLLAAQAMPVRVPLRVLLAGLRKYSMLGSRRPLQDHERLLVLRMAVPVPLQTRPASLHLLLRSLLWHRRRQEQCRGRRGGFRVRQCSGGWEWEHAMLLLLLWHHMLLEGAAEFVLAEPDVRRGGLRAAPLQVLLLREPLQLHGPPVLWGGLHRVVLPLPLSAACAPNAAEPMLRALRPQVPVREGSSAQAGGDALSTCRLWPRHLLERATDRRSDGCIAWEAKLSALGLHSRHSLRRALPGDEPWCCSRM